MPAPYYTPGLVAPDPQSSMGPMYPFPPAQTCRERLTSPCANGKMCHLMRMDMHSFPHPTLSRDRLGCRPRRISELRRSLDPALRSFRRFLGADIHRWSKVISKCLECI